MRTVEEIHKYIMDNNVPFPLPDGLESELQTAMTVEHKRDNAEWREQARAEWAMIQEWPGAKREISETSRQTLEIGRLLNEHIADDIRRRKEYMLDQEKRDTFYASRWEAFEKRQEERFTAMRNDIIPIVKSAIIPAMKEAIDPLKKYLFGNGDDKGCMARRMGNVEEYITTQQKSKQLNWISTAQIITWIFVAVGIAINFLHK
jgi:hypothetical protein